MTRPVIEYVKTSSVQTFRTKADQESTFQVRPAIPAEKLTHDIIFEYVADYIAQQGYPPSMRNIARACQLSVSAVLYNLDKLEAWGWLTREPGVARSLRVLRTPKR